MPSACSAAAVFQQGHSTPHHLECLAVPYWLETYLLGGAGAGGQQDSNGGVVHAGVERDIDQLTYVAIATACAAPCPHYVVHSENVFLKEAAHVDFAVGRKVWADACKGTAAVVVPQLKLGAACETSERGTVAG
jgi:hypothetical protein